jgi:hypothetical protein
VFWNSPDDPQPTSALCWKAGVECSGGGADLRPSVTRPTGAWTATRNRGPAGRRRGAQAGHEYIDFVKNIEAQKQDIDENQRVLVSMIAGVPMGYEDGAELVYEDSPDPDYQASFGIGPGCVLADPVSTAVPPVREREFAEAFRPHRPRAQPVLDLPAGLLGRPAVDRPRSAIRSSRPACPTASATRAGSAGTVEPNCQLYEETFDNVRTAIEECEEVGGEWDAPAGPTVCFALLTDKGTGTPSKIDNMSEECVDEGFNLEFILVRSAAAPAGTTISAPASCPRTRSATAPSCERGRWGCPRGQP